MRRIEAILLSAAVLLASGSARAQDEGDMPPGHPSVGASSPHGGAGGGGGGGGIPGMFNPPEDTEMPDPTLPPGTIAVDLRDADDKPVAGETVTLGIMVNSIAKGDSRSHVQRTTDAAGHAVFGNLDTASSVAYRVSTGYQGGAFAAMPFQMQQTKSMRVVLHVYPVTHDVQQAVIVSEVTLASEMRDDRIQIEEVFTIYNLGRVAWQPLDLDLSLPPGETAFAAQQSMSDQGVDEVGGHGRLRGTFPPGRHAIEFRWQLPWSQDKDVDFKVGMPPHVAIARVMMPASAGIKLVVDGFPPAAIQHDTQGQSFLVTERKAGPQDARLSTLTVGIHDLPTQGPGRTVAVLLAACGVLAGIFFAAGQKRGSGATEQKPARSAILEELAELERGRAAGEVGPKTYERARRELIDALARTLAEA